MQEKAIMIITLLAAQAICCRNAVAQDPILKNSSSIQKNNRDTSLRRNILLNHVLFDTISVADLGKLAEDIKNTDFVHADAYFSGPGYPSVIRMTGGDFSQIVLRFKPGNRIVFENNAIRRADGSILRPFNKSIYIRQ